MTESLCESLSTRCHQYNYISEHDTGLPKPVGVAGIKSVCDLPQQDDSSPELINLQPRGEISQQTEQIEYREIRQLIATSCLIVQITNKPYKKT